MSTVSPYSDDRVFAIVVTYFPDTAVLDALLGSLRCQTTGVIIVDNTPNDDRRVEDYLNLAGKGESIKLVRLGSNLGIARALNVGIDLAVGEGATHVLLSDQDSLPAAGMVSGLLSALGELSRVKGKIGAVGPTFVDRHTGITFPFQAKVEGKFFYGHIAASEAIPFVEALTLITSGTLIPVQVFQHVGEMREDFFIDHVDIEWSHRARAAGYSLHGVHGATMYHSLGDRALRVWYFGWRSESAYGPVRVYYRIRNFVILCRIDWIDRRWKVRNAWYWLGFLYSQVVFGNQRIAALRMAWRGLWDGLHQRTGPLVD